MHNAITIELAEHADMVDYLGDKYMAKLVHPRLVTVEKPAVRRVRLTEKTLEAFKANQAQVDQYCEYKTTQHGVFVNQLKKNEDRQVAKFLLVFPKKCDEITKQGMDLMLTTRHYPGQDDRQLKPNFIPLVERHSGLGPQKWTTTHGTLQWHLSVVEPEDRDFAAASKTQAERDTELHADRYGGMSRVESDDSDDDERRYRDEMDHE